MKNKLWAGFIVGIMTLTMAGVASAIEIVNTGTPVNSTKNWGFDYYYANMALGGQFTLDQGYTITDIEGYMKGSTGSLTAVIYDNLFWPPEFIVAHPGYLLFEQRVTPGSTNAGWYGASGLDWHLDAGTYWAVFEIFYWNGNNFYGEMPNGAPNDLTNEVFRDRNSQWTNNDLGLGIRLYGIPDNTVPIPEPETYAMLIVGLGLMSFIARCRKHKLAA